MKVLFIAPLPPPITGHSMASEVLLGHLQEKHSVAVVNLSTASTHDGRITQRRIVAVLGAMYQIWREKRGADVVYLTISESVFGNIKDILIYCICFNQLDRFYIHLHGGSIKRLLFDVHPILKYLNSIFIHKMAGVIISGQSHISIFKEMIEYNKIHIIPNFAQNYLFIDEVEIHNKFLKLKKMKILYVSGMTAGKGYLKLLEAYELLEDDVRKKIHLDFAGKFDTEAEKAAFNMAIQNLPGVTYHGVVDDGKKQELFSNAHVFCLPTTFFEGQPISILEAYASGNVVVATGQEGIRDVFSDGENGYEIGPNDAGSIERVIRNLVSNPGPLLDMAKRNRQAAVVNYRTDVFSDRVETVLTALSARRPVKL